MPGGSTLLELVKQQVGEQEGTEVVDANCRLKALLSVVMRHQKHPCNVGSRALTSISTAISHASVEDFVIAIRMRGGVQPTCIIDQGVQGQVLLLELVCEVHDRSAHKRVQAQIID